MDELRGRPFTGSDRWNAVAFYPVVIGLALGFVYVVSQLEDPLFLTAIAWYTGVLAVLTVALVLAYATTRRLPDGRWGAVGEDRAVIVSAWPWQWRWDVTADAGLSVLATYLFVSSLGSREAGPIAPVVLLVPVIWFGGATILTLTGRRRLSALMLTDADLVRDSVNGRERIRRDQVIDVTTVAGRVLITFSGSADRRTAPRPWQKRHRLHDSVLVVDGRLLGPEPEALVAWLRRELALRPDPTDDSSSKGPATTTIARWFRRPR